MNQFRSLREGQGSEGEGKIASSRGSCVIATLRADRVLERCAIVPTANYRLAHSEYGRIAAFPHRDETLHPVRNGPIYYCGVVDVISGATENLRGCIGVLDRPNLEGGCATSGA